MCQRHENIEPLESVPVRRTWSQPSPSAGARVCALRLPPSAATPKVRLAPAAHSGSARAFRIWGCLRPHRLRRRGQVQTGLLRRFPPSGGRLKRACGPGDTHRPRSGCLGVPDNDGVNRGFPPSKARVSEQPGFGNRRYRLSDTSPNTLLFRDLRLFRCYPFLPLYYRVYYQ